MLPSDRPTQPITSPFNPGSFFHSQTLQEPLDKWDSARVVHNSSAEWAPTPQKAVDTWNEHFNTAKSSSFSSHTPPQTAAAPTLGTVKTDSTAFSMMRHTNSTQMETPRSEGRVTNPFSASSRTHVDYPALKLTQRSVDLIKKDFVERRSAINPPFEPQHMEMISTVELYKDSLSSRLEDCGQALDAMVGCRYVSITDAMKSLEQMVSMGVITDQEVALSHDCEQIANSSANDVISIHSLSNLVMKILDGREKK